jgi:hypothetical protein
MKKQMPSFAAARVGQYSAERHLGKEWVASQARVTGRVPQDITQRHHRGETFSSTHGRATGRVPEDVTQRHHAGEKI